MCCFDTGEFLRDATTIATNFTCSLFDLTTMTMEQLKEVKDHDVCVIVRKYLHSHIHNICVPSMSLFISYYHLLNVGDAICKLIDLDQKWENNETACTPVDFATAYQVRF